MVSYDSNSNATLSVVLTFLETNNISKERILNVFHDGTAYVAIYTTTI